MEKRVLEHSMYPEKLDCGLDEAGRGALCGRVYAAAVILPPASSFPDEFYLSINDSKALSAKKRFILSEYIKKHALAYAVTYAEVDDIDRLNILQATMEAMHDAIRTIKTQSPVEHLTIDGSYWRTMTGSDAYIPVTCAVDGDQKYRHVAAASILAKTHRDAYMLEIAVANPDFEAKYKWSKNKGYGTAEHMAGIKAFGISPHHRKSFAPCK